MAQNHTMVRPGEVLTAVDYGDAGVDPWSTEKSHEEVRRRVREIVEAGAIPIVLGGDHSLKRPDVGALADVYSPGNVGVIHFDAHYDAASNHFGYTYTHGTMIYNLVDDSPEVLNGASQATRLGIISLASIGLSSNHC